MATELASAYVTLIPSLRGAQKEIESQLAGVDLSNTGKKVGSSITSGISEQIKSTAGLVGGIGGTLTGTFGKVAKVGIGAIAGIGTALTGLAAKGGLSRALNLEQAQTMFKGLKLDWKDYESTVKEAVDGTAFTLDAAALTAASMAAAGVGAGDSMKKALNGAVGVAATFGADLGEIGQIFSKVAAQGKLSGETIQQFADRGINATSVLSEYLGKSGDEVKKLVKDGKIDFQTFSDAMYAAFGDSAMAANETFTGSMANMRSALNKIGENFATPFKDNAIPVFNAVREALNAIRTMLDPVVSKFSNFANIVSGRLVGSIQIFTARLKESGSIASAMQGAIDHAFGDGAYSKIMAIVTAIGTLATLGSVMTTMAKGMNIASAAMEKISVIGNRLQSIGASVGSFVSRLGGASLSAITTFGKSLQYGLIPDGVLTKIRGLGTDLSYGLRDCKQDLENSFSGLKNSIASKFSGIGEAISSKLSPITSKIAPILSNVKSVIGESLGNAADSFRNRFNIGSHADSEGSKVSNAFSKIKDSASKLGAPLLSATAGLTAVAGGLLVAGLAAAATGVDLQGTADKVLETINGLTANLPVVAQQFATIIPGLISSVVAAIPALVSAFNQALTSLVQVFPVILPMLVEGLTQLVVQLAPILITMIPVLLDAGLQLFTALVNSLSEILPVLIAMLPELVNQVATVLVANLPLLLQAGLTLFLALVQAFVEMLPTLIAQLPALIDQVGNTLISFLPQLGTAAGQLFMAIVQAVPKILGSLIGAVGSLLGQIPGKIVSFASNIANAARNMMLGMIEGIKGAVGNIIGAIGGVCSDIVNNVKGFFGIHSPSKLMEKLFGYVGAGAAIGLSGSAKEVVSAMGAMSKDVANEASRLNPVIPIGVSQDSMFSTGKASSIVEDQLNIDANNASNSEMLSRIEAAISNGNASTNNVLLEIANMLLAALSDIYNIIPEGESEWDFNRRVRRAIA